LVQRFTTAVREALAKGNWQAALMCALTLPDICGWLEDPTKGAGARYVEWCRQFLQPRYTRRVGAQAQEHIFLSGEDCYALRCALLHEGTDTTLRQRARDALERFLFLAPSTRVVHCNQSGTTLQLQVDLFCEDICEGVDEWQRRVMARSPEVRSRLPELISIGSGDRAVSF
jgi:hypothetical protein